ncbi:unnamed protein product [Brassica oleracea var. botrytis]
MSCVETNNKLRLNLQNKQQPNNQTNRRSRRKLKKSVHLIVESMVKAHGCSDASIIIIIIQIPVSTFFPFEQLSSSARESSDVSESRRTRKIDVPRRSQDRPLDRCKNSNKAQIFRCQWRDHVLYAKIWDIRKKGCIQTYKGHTRGISTVKFTPDGRWLVSGGLDNVVKLLHEFKFHDGPIRSLDSHPLEFLLATGEFLWYIFSIRSIAFHPDGQTLFCGLDDGLKVYSWEPMICRDSVWVWVSDISKLEPLELDLRMGMNA